RHSENTLSFCGRSLHEEEEETSSRCIAPTRFRSQEPAAIPVVSAAMRDEAAGFVGSGRILIVRPQVASNKYRARANLSAAGLISSRPCPYTFSMPSRCSTKILV